MKQQKFFEGVMPVKDEIAKTCKSPDLWVGKVFPWISNAEAAMNEKMLALDSLDKYHYEISCVPAQVVLAATGGKSVGHLVVLEITCKNAAGIVIGQFSEKAYLRMARTEGSDRIFYADLYTDDEYRDVALFSRSETGTTEQ